MTIQNTIYISEVQILKTKTEVEIINENKVLVSRIIDSKIHSYEFDSETPITMRFVSNLTKLDNDMFILVCKPIDLYT